MLVKILFVVIVGELSTGLYRAFGEYVYSFVADVYLAIRGARMIDKSRGVVRNISVYHRVLAGPKKIFAAAEFLLGFRHGLAFVFDDAGTWRDVCIGK